MRHKRGSARRVPRWPHRTRARSACWRAGSCRLHCEPLEPRLMLAADILLEAIADATIEAARPDENYGSYPLLVTRDAHGDTTAESVIRFDLLGITGSVTHADVWLSPVWTSRSGITNEAALLSDSAWSEGSVTWHERPDAGEVLAGWTAETGVPARIDVTRAVRTILEVPLPGDMDGNGRVDFDDIGAFVLGIVCPPEYADLYGVGPVVHGDVNQDGQFDFDDIPAFVAALRAPQNTLRYLDLRIYSTATSPGMDEVWYGSRETGDAVTDPGGNLHARPLLAIYHSTGAETATAIDDGFTVAKDSAGNWFDVLHNDSSLRGPNTSLVITDVSAPNWRGTVTVTPNGRSLQYVPRPGFVGMETFDYTITDGAGGADRATVRVTVRDADGSTTPIPTRLNALNPSPYGWFGSAISLAGNEALIGADGCCQSLTLEGAAFVFQQQADGTRQQTAKLVASDRDVTDFFGGAVSISGDTALIGAIGDDDLGSDAGSAYIFERQVDGAWAQVTKLIAPDGHALHAFGCSVSVLGARAVVGAQGDQTQGVDAGSAYIFERQIDGTWQQVAKILASDGDAGNRFSKSVSLADGRVVVGASFADGLAPEAGAVYVFERQADGTWTQTAKLVALDGASQMMFGWAVSAGGDGVLVGAPAHAEWGHETLAGSAYVFAEQGDGSWQQETKLVDPDTGLGHRFGEAVALADDRAVVGATPARWPLNLPGAAYVFVRNADGTWPQVDRLAIGEGYATDNHGGSVAITATQLLVGGEGANDAGPGSGSVYAYEATWLPALAVDIEDDAFDVASGATYVPLDVLANDYLSAEELRIQSVGQTSQGGVAWTDGSRLLYTARPGFVGADTFTYQTNGSGETGDRTAAVTVKINPGQGLDPPVFTPTAFRSDGLNLVVTYDIAGRYAGPIQVGVYRSADGVTLDEQLMTYRVTDPAKLAIGAGQSVTFPAAFAGAWNAGYRLVAQLELLEGNPQAATLRFAGGVFHDADAAVWVFGTPASDHIVVTEDEIQIDSLPTTSYAVALWSATALHVLTYGGNDVVEVGSRVLAPRHIFAGNGDDVIIGATRSDIVDGGLGNNLIDNDNDGDGLLNSAEASSGTDREDFDTDDDLLSDGFEKMAAGLDPLIPNDPKGDLDGDGLSNISESIFGTHPNVTDSDGDGVSDGDEVDQGSDPADSGDAGIAPASDSVAAVELTVGDDSGSASEVYELIVGKFHHVSPDHGVVSPWTRYKFAVGQQYPIRLVHRDSILATPDYDWYADLRRWADETRPIIVEDPPYELLGFPNDSRHECSMLCDFLAEGKVSYLYIPIVDLDIITSGGGELADDLEEVPGSYVPLNFDDDDRDGIPDFDLQDRGVPDGDDNLVALKLHKIAPVGLKGTYTLDFPEAQVHLWADRKKTERVLANATVFDIGVDHLVYVEGIVASDALGCVAINLVFSAVPGGGTTFHGNVSDQVRLTVGQFDLALGGVSDAYEADPGAIVWRNSDFSKAMPDPDNDPDRPPRYLPDYRPVVDLGDPQESFYELDPEFAADYTAARITAAHWMIGQYGVKLTFPANILVWRLDDPQYPVQIQSETTLPLSATTLDLWVEGIDSSSGFRTDSIRAEAVPLSADNPFANILLSDEVCYTVVETNAGVDGNRDARIDFANSHDRQLLFWFNTDGETVDEDGYEREAVDFFRPDCADTAITERRDLEDFAPLRLFVDPNLVAFGWDRSLPGLPADTEQLQVEYRLFLAHADGTFLRLYTANNTTDDVWQHVRDNARAEMQANDPFFTTAVVPMAGNVQLSDIAQGVNRYLFEGFGDTPRQIQLEFSAKVFYPDGSATEKVHCIELGMRDIKEFYCRYDIEYELPEGIDLRQDLSLAHFPDAVAGHQSQVGAETFFDGDDTIVLVHGWNMAAAPKNDWKTAFAETAYKRLYWQGFQGTFVAFNWPTFTDAEGPRDWMGIGAAANLTYNPSEYQAYRSGRALKNLLADLKPAGRTHLLAHSMGNIVAAESLRQWSRESPDSLVDTYVAMEAATSAGLYGWGGNVAFDIMIEVPAAGLLAWPHEVYSESRVDLNLAWWSGFEGGSDPSAPYMAGAKTAAAKWVNLYNPEDVAVNQAWRGNNLVKHFLNAEDPQVPDLPGAGDDIWDYLLWQFGFGINDELWRLLPPPAIWPWRYVVEQDEVNGHRYYRVPYTTEADLNTNRADWIELTTGLHNSINEPGPHAYEIIAFMAQANAETVGTTALFEWFDENVDIGLVIPTAVGGPKVRENHSFQFQHDAAMVSPFWETIRLETGFSSTLAAGGGAGVAAVITAQFKAAALPTFPQQGDDSIMRNELVTVVSDNSLHASSTWPQHAEKPANRRGVTQPSCDAGRKSRTYGLSIHSRIASPVRYSGRESGDSRPKRIPLGDRVPGTAGTTLPPDFVDTALNELLDDDRLLFRNKSDW